MTSRTNGTLNMYQIAQAIRLLKDARDLLKQAGAPKTLARVRAALTSAGGAERHAYGMYLRSTRPAHTAQPRARGPK